MIPNVTIFALIVITIIVSLHNPIVGHGINDRCAKIEIAGDYSVIEVQLDFIESLFWLLILR
jgi:hypothetical protein